MKRSSVVVEIVDDEVVGVTSILSEWSVGTSKYPAWMQGVWQSHSRHADLRKVSKQKHPSMQKFLAGPLGMPSTRRPSFPT
jgi:hypothetical protein